MSSESKLPSSNSDSDFGADSDSGIEVMISNVIDIKSTRNGISRGISMRMDHLQINLGSSRLSILIIDPIGYSHGDTELEFDSGADSGVDSGTGS